MLARLAFVLALAAVVLACASAEKAYTDGMALEQSGDMVGAADAYATALERDRTLSNVAGRLAIAGREAVRVHLGRAAGLDAQAAAHAYLAADALIARAAAVGVGLDRPASFEADLDARLDAAVEALLADARRQSDAGDPAVAVDRTVAARAFRPTDAQAAALDRVAADAFGRWAAADLAAGRFRAALAHADEGLVLAPDAARRAALDAVRADVLADGAVFVAVLPAEGHDPAFARDVSDVLSDDHLQATDPFVVFADPAATRRWARDHDRGPSLADVPRRLADAARDLRADLGVVAAVGRIGTEETKREPRTETATVRATGARASYTLRVTRLDLDAQADVIVVDAATRRTVCDRSARATARADADLGTYAGDWRDLELSRSARAAFAADALDRALDEARDELRDRLAAAIADRIDECLRPLVR